MPSKRFSADPFIFGLSSLFFCLLLLFAFLNLEGLRAQLISLQAIILSNFSWLFIASVNIFIVYSFYLIFSKYAHIKIGGQEASPDYNYLSWFTMLFSAGMGIGLVFYGVAEPIMHFTSPPFNTPAESIASAKEAMRITIFHWGISAWSIYAVLALALAYTHFNLGLPLAIRSTLKPLLGDSFNKLPGKLIDVLAVITTLFGLATSLGLGATQINAGLNQLFNIDFSQSTQIIIICLITFFAGLSLMAGLDKGIKKLSEINISAAFVLLLFILITGPSIYLLNSIPLNLMEYTKHFLSMNILAEPFIDKQWVQSWTIFYWAWWISWSPFVAMFVARISKGRSIREFMLGVILAPSFAGLIWFSILGGSSLHIELFGNGGISEAVNDNIATAIFVLLNNLPYASLTSLLAIFIIATFFITSSDSGSFVVDMLASGGNPTPQLWQRLYWVSIEGFIAIFLLVIGGLSALQTGVISSGLPFCLVLIAVCISLQKNLRLHQFTIK
jgi:choline/glycine/proline betaine transport protein